jgi:hypothetical protein
MLSITNKKPRLQSSSHPPTEFSSNSLANRNSLRDMPLSHIHEAFVKSSSLLQASQSLGVKDDTLARFISNLNYDKQPMDFDRFKTLTRSELQTRFVYTDLVKERHRLIDELSLEEILAFIEPKTKLRAAANLLGVTAETLEKFLINTVGAVEDTCFYTLKERLRSNLRKTGTSITTEGFPSTPIELESATPAPAMAVGITPLTQLDVDEYFSSLLENSADHQTDLVPPRDLNLSLATADLPVMGSQFDNPHMFFPSPKRKKRKAVTKIAGASLLDPEIMHFDSLNP